ncbi:MAG: hypothetical protein ACPHEP_04400 [Acidimicrobiales bacterium]
MNHLKEMTQFVENGDFEVTDEGVLIHRGILAKGKYTHSINGEDVRVDTNLIPSEGIASILSVAFGADTQITAWYLAVFSGAVTPAANWTAANFTATASEITSNTEGYSDATRPAWTPGAVTNGVIGNLASKATFNIVCTTSVNIAGAALLSSNTKGGTTGVLASATRFASTRQVYNGDAFELGYEIELQDT